VKLGQRQGDDVVVTQGVSANERVVVAGQMLVRPGGKVRIASANSGASPNADNTKNASAGGD
jgi:multidrug efflux pump subunit AcrA (membrane-fusion protein)